MDFEGFKEALKSTGNEELLKFFDSYVLSSDDKSKLSDEIRKRKSANKEAQDLKRFKSAVEQLGFDGEQDLNGFVDALTDTVEGKKNQNTTETSDLNNQVRKLQKDFEKSQKQLTEEQGRREKLQTQHKQKTIESKLIQRLDGEIYNAEDRVWRMIHDGTVDVDDMGDIVFKNGEDTQMNFDEGIKWVVSNNQDIRKNRQSSGAGSKGSFSSAGLKYSIEDVKKMSNEETMANMDEVKKTMAAVNNKP